MNPLTVVKKTFRGLGIYIFRAGNLPRQIDLWVDFKKCNPKPEVIFDIGANVGSFSRAAARTFPATTVYAFEPVSGTFSILLKKTKGISQIRPYQHAFGEKNGNATMHLRQQSGWNSLLDNLNTPANSTGRSENVAVCTIDSFCLTNNISFIDLLKTDTEGFDNFVLLGARRMLEESRIGAVYSEITFSERDHTHTQFMQIYETLRAFNFVCHGIYDPEGQGESMCSNALFLARQHQT
jgi:FkbM family methyltransferase